MKHIIIALALVSFIFTSCSKDEIVYSCDEETNDYVKENLNQLKSITYDDLIEYEVGYQKAIFRALSNDMKSAMWKEKLSRCQDLQWETDQATFIQNMENAVNADWWDDNLSQSDIEKRDDYLQGMVMQGNTNLGLSMEMLFSLFGRIDIPINSGTPATMKPTPYGSNNVTMHGGSLSSDCKCSKGSDWCLQSGYSCEDDDLGCTSTTRGCGTIWVYSCDGICQ